MEHRGTGSITSCFAKRVGTEGHKVKQCSCANRGHEQIVLHWNTIASLTPDCPEGVLVPYGPRVDPRMQDREEYSMVDRETQTEGAQCAVEGASANKASAHEASNKATRDTTSSNEDGPNNTPHNTPDGAHGAQACQQAYGGLGAPRFEGRSGGAHSGDCFARGSG